MLKKKEFYKWEKIKLIENKAYPHISFVTAYYLFGIPLYKYEKFVPNKIDQFDLEESGYTEVVTKKTGTYNPIKDESKKLEGTIENNFE